MNAKQALKKAEELLSKGEEHSAKSIVLKYRLAPGQNADDYFRWAKLCEDFALDNLALECISVALSKDPENPKYLLMQANINYRLGKLSDTVRILRHLLEIKDSLTVRDFLAKVLVEMGQKGAARVVSKRNKVHTTTTPLLRRFPPNLGYNELEPFFVLFRSRKIHAELVLTPLGKTALLFRKDGITVRKLRDHLLGRIYIIYFPLLEDKTLVSCFLHTSIPSDQIEKHFKEESWLEGKKELLKHHALNLFKIAYSWNLNPALERMNRFTYRLWFFFKEPVHFLWTERFLDTLINRFPLPEGGIVYNKGIPIEGRGIGWRERGFELPLGINPVSLERSLFVDVKGKPYPEQLKFIKRIIPISFSTLREFCCKSQIEFSDIPYPAELIKLRTRCSIIDHIIKRAETGKQLSREEKLAIMLTIGFLKNGRDCVHRIFSGTPDYSYIKLERLFKSLPKKPISCNKLEVWFSSFVLETPCTCIFGSLLKERYPSPLLHINPKLVPSKYNCYSLTYSKPTELAKMYLKLKEKLYFLERELIEFLKKNPNKKIKVGNYSLFLANNKLSVYKTSKK